MPSGLGQKREVGPGGEALMLGKGGPDILRERGERHLKASKEGQEGKAPAGRGAGAQEGEQEGGQVERWEASEHGPASLAALCSRWQTDRKDQYQMP